MATSDSLSLVLPALPCTHTLVPPILGEKEDPSDSTRTETVLPAKPKMLCGRGDSFREVEQLVQSHTVNGGS